MLNVNIGYRFSSRVKNSITDKILQIIKGELQKFENTENAQAMAAYMKTMMPFYGVRAVARRCIAKQVNKQHPIHNQQDYLELIKVLWAQPYREEKYIAIDIARMYPGYIDMQALPLFEKMIREGAWWDFVDDIAINLVGHIVLKNPTMMLPILEQWINDANRWIRRTSIICQNKFKNRTHAELLFTFCLQCSHEKDFFIKKAIGWALREYAKTEPAKVHEFVVINKDSFSALSYKEAVKNLI